MNEGIFPKILGFLGSFITSPTYRHCGPGRVDKVQWIWGRGSIGLSLRSGLESYVDP